MKEILTLLLFTAIQSLWAQDKLYSLELLVSNVQQSSGQLVVALYDAPEKFLTNDVYRNFSFPVFSETAISQRISKLDQGIYAISVYHDTNDNGKLDLNALGLPIEPVGFSNNARSWLGPPRFQKASFTVASNLVHISIRLK